VCREGGCAEAISESKGGRDLRTARGALEQWVKSAPSNKRLKLTGADRFQGIGVL